MEFGVVLVFTSFCVCAAMLVTKYLYHQEVNMTCGLGLMFLSFCIFAVMLITKWLEDKPMRAHLKAKIEEDRLKDEKSRAYNAACELEEKTSLIDSLFVKALSIHSRIGCDQSVAFNLSGDLLKSDIKDFVISCRKLNDWG